MTKMMGKYGLDNTKDGAGVLNILDPFNIFQNTPLYTLKLLGCNRAGDFIKFKTLEDTVYTISYYSFDIINTILFY